MKKFCKVKQTWAQGDENAEIQVSWVVKSVQRSLENFHGRLEFVERRLIMIDVEFFASNAFSQNVRSPKIEYPGGPCTIWAPQDRPPKASDDVDVNEILERRSTLLGTLRNGKGIDLDRQGYAGDLADCDQLASFQATSKQEELVKQRVKELSNSNLYTDLPKARNPAGGVLLLRCELKQNIH